MAHHTNQSAYNNLVEKLNRFPQSAPPSELLTKILKILSSDKDAELVSLIPIKLFSADKACKIWKIDLVEAKKILDRVLKPLKELFKNEKPYKFLDTIEEDDY